MGTEHFPPLGVCMRVSLTTQMIPVTLVDSAVYPGETCDILSNGVCGWLF